MGVKGCALTSLRQRAWERGCMCFPSIPDQCFLYMHYIGTEWIQHKTKMRSDTKYHLTFQEFNWMPLGLGKIFGNGAMGLPLWSYCGLGHLWVYVNDIHDQLQYHNLYPLILFSPYLTLPVQAKLSSQHCTQQSCCRWFIACGVSLLLNPSLLSSLVCSVPCMW